MRDKVWLGLGGKCGDGGLGLVGRALGAGRMKMMMVNIRALHLLLFVATTLPSSSSSWSTFLPTSLSTASSASSSSCRAASFSSEHHHDKKKTSTSSTPKQQQQQTMVIVDVENVRGATSFKISHAALLSRIRLWREDRLLLTTTTSSSSASIISDVSNYSPSIQQHNMIEPMIWVCDHGIRPSIHHFSSSSCHYPSNVDNEDGKDVGVEMNEKYEGGSRMPCNFGVTFAGPQRTADDVIVDIVKLRCQSTSDDQEEEEENVKLDNSSDDDDDDDWSIPPPTIAIRNTTVVITADTKLISRCQQAQRASGRSLSDVIFVEPASLLMQLERYRINSHEEVTFLGGEDKKQQQQQPSTSFMSAGMRKKNEIGKGNVDGKTSTMTSFKDSIIAMEQHAKFQARYQRSDINKNGGDEDVVNENIHKIEYDNNEDYETQSTTDDSSDSSSDAALLAAQLKTEQIRRHLLLSDAYYLARPSKSVRGRGKAVVHVNYKDRNISKTQQQKLYTRRLGNQRKEDMALGATRRKENAARLQQILDNYNGGVDRVIDQNGPLISSSTTLLHMLLHQFESEHEFQLLNTADTSSSSSDPTTALGLDGTTNGAISIVKQLDPLNSIMKVPKRNNDAMSNNGLPPLRIVVISDTHGFEGALSKFIDSSPTDNNDIGSPNWVQLGFSDDFILPPADVLIHCGDFAASGSRKTQRIAARRLDDFLARQTHIPEKVVIKGNHDPESPAKILFPTSKALYVRSSSIMVIHGVSFALEPYSRRIISLQSIGRRTYSSMPTLPECDVLVSHEPPKGILDMTYHGFSAGSLYLRELVEHAEHKPRLWLCGHIHESRGVLEKHFYSVNRNNGGNDNDINTSTTMVINASNANSGKANRLVSGAVVVEIERRPSKTWCEETAETTLRSLRRVDNEEGVFDPIDNSSYGLARLGDDLELYTTRPGVRRRKGVAQSVRQQKVIRTTLLSS